MEVTAWQLNRPVCCLVWVANELGRVAANESSHRRRQPRVVKQFIYVYIGIVVGARSTVGTRTRGVHTVANPDGGLVLAVPVSPQQPLDLRTERTGVCEPRHAVPSSTVALL
ncbi:hypothetical protein WJX79_009370 [Trebouxia sp. C0005]